MSAILNLSESQYTLSVLLGEDLSSAEDVLRRLSSAGILVHAWRLASTEWPGQARLIVDVTGDASVVRQVLSENPALNDGKLFDFSESIRLELALITICAQGALQDEASSLVASAGGRLVSLHERGFSAQISAEPEIIDSLLRKLRQLATVDAVRSGGLLLQKAER